MKKIILGLLAGLTCTFANGAHASGDIVDWALRYRLIHAAHAEDLAHLYNDVDLSAGEPRTGDLLAEYLLRVAPDPRLDGHEAADMVAALARRPGARWRAAMQKIRESDAPVLLKAAAFDYVLHHPAAAEEYAPGSIDVAALRIADSQAALAIHATDERARRLGALARGQTPAEVFAQVGFPQSARVAQVANVRRLLCFYRGAGRVVFGAVKNDPWRQQGSVADALLFEEEMPYRESPAQFAQPDDVGLRMIQIASGRPYPLKMALAASYDGAAPVELLDAAAEWLAQNWRTVNDGNEDALAWAARLLRTRGGVRYSVLLKQVAHDIKSPKVRRYAKLTALRVKDVPTAPYVPGTVSLADVARKHPDLYPDVTFTSGLL